MQMLKLRTIVLIIVFISMFWLFTREVHPMNAQGIIDPHNPDLYTMVDAVAWSPDGSMLALGSGMYGVPEGIADYRVRVVNLATQ
jgi:hypothetical protein